MSEPVKIAINLDRDKLAKILDPTFASSVAKKIHLILTWKDLQERNISTYPRINCLTPFYDGSGWVLPVLAINPGTDIQYFLFYINDKLEIEWDAGYRQVRSGWVRENWYIYNYDRDELLAIGCDLSTLAGYYRRYRYSDLSLITEQSLGVNFEYIYGYPTFDGGARALMIPQGMKDVYGVSLSDLTTDPITLTQGNLLYHILWPNGVIEGIKPVQWGEDLIATAEVIVDNCGTELSWIFFGNLGMSEMLVGAPLLINAPLTGLNEYVDVLSPTITTIGGRVVLLMVLSLFGHQAKAIAAYDIDPEKVLNPMNYPYLRGQYTFSGAGNVIVSTWGHRVLEVAVNQAVTLTVYETLFNQDSQLASITGPGVVKIQDPPRYVKISVSGATDVVVYLSR